MQFNIANGWKASNLGGNTLWKEQDGKTVAVYECFDSSVVAEVYEGPVQHCDRRYLKNPPAILAKMRRTRATRPNPDPLLVGLRWAERQISDSDLSDTFIARYKELRRTKDGDADV